MATRPYPSFLLFKDSTGDIRWHLQAANGKIIADSGEGYRKLADADHGIELVKQSAQFEIWETEDIAKLRR